MFAMFGSRVRGEATPESDLDVYLVVTELTPAQRRWIDEIAWEVGFDKDRVISTLVTDSPRFGHRARLARAACPPGHRGEEGIPI